MEEIFIEDKQKYFDENYPFEDPSGLTDKKRCIHCDQIITVGDFKVFRDEDDNEFIYCPNAPYCDGTVIDWIDLEFN